MSVNNFYLITWHQQLAVGVTDSVVWDKRSHRAPVEYVIPVTLNLSLKLYKIRFFSLGGTS